MTIPVFGGIDSPKDAVLLLISLGGGVGLGGIRRVSGTFIWPFLL